MSNTVTYQTESAKIKSIKYYYIRLKRQIYNKSIKSDI